MSEIKTIEPVSPPRDPVILFRALSETLRLRALGALAVAELSVAELTEVLDTPQSTISRHLARLREAGLVATRRQGALVFYSLGPALGDGRGRWIADSAAALPGAASDRRAVERILERRRRRSREFFDAVARRHAEAAEPGGSWQALAEALALGFDGKIVADIGAGQGALSLLLADSARTVYAVDHSPRMVRRLKEKTRKADNIIVRKGDFEALPLETASCDVAVASQVLHHCPRPREALAEAFRVLRPGGRLIAIDLAAHEQEWVRDKLADQWLGFDAAELKSWAEAAGFGRVAVRQAPGPRDALAVVILTGLKAAGERRTVATTSRKREI